MRHLLGDCSGIQGRSIVEIVGVVRRRIRCGHWTWMIRMGGSRTIWLRPWLGHRRSMNHRTIHEASYCEDGSAPEENRP